MWDLPRRRWRRSRARRAKVQLTDFVGFSFQRLLTLWDICRWESLRRAAAAAALLTITIQSSAAAEVLVLWRKARAHQAAFLVEDTELAGAVTHRLRANRAPLFTSAPALSRAATTSVLQHWVALWRGVFCNLVVGTFKSAPASTSTFKQATCFSELQSWEQQ
ncbi:unnamed protein product [Pelagomonas calceolata]|uniref:Uncharacterized protein n=1 Tax=Pelagomonas calceolata TaxID=35677 RepID=A0A8J2X775_9STRA|nr:unnamed protein product [Pelagomonas calceolata]